MGVSETVELSRDFAHIEMEPQSDQTDLAHVSLYTQGLGQDRPPVENSEADSAKADSAQSDLEEKFVVTHEVSINVDHTSASDPPCQVFHLHSGCNEKYESYVEELQHGSTCVSSQTYEPHRESADVRLSCLSDAHHRQCHDPDTDTDTTNRRYREDAVLPEAPTAVRNPPQLDNNLDDEDSIVPPSIPENSELYLDIISRAGTNLDLAQTWLADMALPIRSGSLKHLSAAAALGAARFDEAFRREQELELHQATVVEEGSTRPAGSSTRGVDLEATAPTTPERGELDVEATARSAGAPSNFFCPISMDLMRDPVMLATGHTFENRSIRTWLTDQVANPTCPVTRKVLLPPVELIPNLALRNSIEEWAAHHCCNILDGDGHVRQVLAGITSLEARSRDITLGPRQLGKVAAV
ncbi:Retinoblastoma-like protein 1, variant 2 [Cymbomonas tetramitiformis]|uniref:Retinoblastoma-like protein 1, variant 2 n=1 Tax=Cymbomonas tetramitiformis TaxID=36881 RepID=A0AAE0GV24_9CHLO|nr:Retinoblastoma-like protein 1, variant 2 [Cymbomonas tetramitiformis]